MNEPIKAQWYHIEAIRELEGVVDVLWNVPLHVTICRDVRDKVRTVLSEKGFNGPVDFAEIPDDLDAIIAHQETWLNNFALLLFPSSYRADLANFGIPLDDPIFDSSHALWKAVDEVMKEQGVTSEQIRNLHMRSRNFDEEPAYLAVLLPLFRALRKRGFSAIELRG